MKVCWLGRNPFGGHKYSEEKGDIETKVTPDREEIRGWLSEEYGAPCRGQLKEKRR